MIGICQNAGATTVIAYVYTKIAILVHCNLCRHNLQFSIPRIKNTLNKTTDLIKSGLGWHKDN
jgi:hypothetical protein